MNRKQTIRRLGVVSVLLGLLMLSTAAPAMPAEPFGATMGITANAAWAGHPACGAPVGVELTGDVTNVGGYETKLTFDAAYMGYTSGNVAQGDFLSSTGRNTSGDDGTPLLEATEADSVKFGDYSWGDADGPDAPGTLATVKLDVAACGVSSLGLSETQVVDIMGAPFTIDGEAGVSITVHNMLNTNGDVIPVVTGQDVLVVANALNASVACDASYQYNTNGDPIPVVTGQDVLAVANALNSSVACP